MRNNMCLTKSGTFITESLTGRGISIVIIKDRGSRFTLNIDNHLQDCTVSQLTRLQFKSSPHFLLNLNLRHNIWEFRVINCEEVLRKCICFKLEGRKLFFSEATLSLTRDLLIILMVCRDHKVPPYSLS
jgi:hypothetical protein